MAVATYIPAPSREAGRFSSELEYRPDIDGLRAIAVLLVVGFHAFPDLVRGGFIGVDVFFVVSGYLISGIIFARLQTDSFSLQEFCARRIKRIFPALILVLVASYVFGWFGLLADEYKRLSMHIAGGAGFAANITLWRETNYFSGAQGNPLTHLWSLGVEEQFYLLWPLLLWLLWRRRMSFVRIVLLIGILSFIVNVAGPCSQSATFYLPASRFWELLLGSGLAYIGRQKSNWWAGRTKESGVDEPRQGKGELIANLASGFGVLLLGVGVALIDKDKQFPGWWALLPTLGTFFMVSAGPGAWLNRNVLTNRVLVWIGLISYPLYLWHWPLLSFASIIQGQLPELGVRLALVGVSIALAALTYVIVEKPIRFGGHVRAKVAVLGLSMALVGCVGYATYALDGLEFRGANDVFKTNLDQLGWFQPDPTCLRLLDLEKEFQDKQSVFCTLQDQVNQVQVAVFGDSTANALYPGFEKVFKEEHIGVINVGDGTCAPFRGLEGTFDWNRDCKEINDKIYDFLLKNSRIKTVVLGAAAWDVANMRFAGLPDYASLEARFAALSKLMEKDVDDLERTGKKVVVTFDSPLFNINPRGCIRVSVFWKHLPGCTFSEQQLANREPYITMWRAMMAERPKVCVFEQSPEVRVDGQYRILSSDGILLFRDYEHLSYLGSEQVARGFLNSVCGQWVQGHPRCGTRKGLETSEPQGFPVPHNREKRALQLDFKAGN